MVRLLTLLAIASTVLLGCTLVPCYAQNQEVTGELAIGPVSPVCEPEQEGISGTYTEGEVTIKFWSCATPEMEACPRHARGRG